MLIILVTGMNNTSNVSQGNNRTFTVSQCNNCQLSPSEVIHQRNKVYCIVVITV